MLVVLFCAALFIVSVAGAWSICCAEVRVADEAAVCAEARKVALRAAGVRRSVSCALGLPTVCLALGGENKV